MTSSTRPSVPLHPERSQAQEDLGNGGRHQARAEHAQGECQHPFEACHGGVEKRLVLGHRQAEPRFARRRADGALVSDDRLAIRAGQAVAVDRAVEEFVGGQRHGLVPEGARAQQRHARRVGDLPIMPGIRSAVLGFAEVLAKAYGVVCRHLQPRGQQIQLGLEPLGHLRLAMGAEDFRQSEAADGERRQDPDESAGQQPKVQRAGSAHDASRR